MYASVPCAAVLTIRPQGPGPEPFGLGLGAWGLGLCTPIDLVRHPLTDDVERAFETQGPKIIAIFS